jgi:hypothetical protein
VSYQRCVDTDMLHAPSWEGVAAAHHGLGHMEDSERCRETAQGILESLEESRVEAALRAEHSLLARDIERDASVHGQG